jgi:uncharacterized protein
LHAKAAPLLQTDTTRLTLPQDMTDQERQLMEEHGHYFQEQFVAGRLLLYGPVMASSGAIGLGILEVESEEEARRDRATHP